MMSFVAAAALAADGSEFYENLYRRGVAHFNEGNYDAAQRELRIAAFGFIESIPRFETTTAYLVAAARRTKADDEARLSLQKLLNAEKVTRTYASLPLPADVRATVDEAARALLPRDQSAMLRAGGSAGVVAPQPMTTQPAPRTETVIITEPIAPPSPAPQPTQPAPAPAPRTEAVVITEPIAPPSPAPQRTTTQPAPPPAPRTETVVITEPIAPPSPTSQPTTQPATRTETTEPIAAPSNSATSRPQPQPDTIDVPTQLRAGDAAIVRSDLAAARAAYGAALTANVLSHADALRLAEGLYRARDFRGVIAAFARAGSLARGEEPYRYYLAVAYYETGQYAAAKRELAAVLPFIEVTPDVARYQSRIAGAIE